MYLSTTTGRNTNKAEPGQGQWIWLGQAAIWMARGEGGKGGRRRTGLRRYQPANQPKPNMEDGAATAMGWGLWVWTFLQKTSPSVNHSTVTTQDHPLPGNTFLLAFSFKASHHVLMITVIAAHWQIYRVVTNSNLIFTLWSIISSFTFFCYTCFINWSHSDWIWIDFFFPLLSRILVWLIFMRVTESIY